MDMGRHLRIGSARLGSMKGYDFLRRIYHVCYEMTLSAANHLMHSLFLMSGPDRPHCLTRAYDFANANDKLHYNWVSRPRLRFA